MSRNIFEGNVPSEDLGGLYDEPVGTELEILEKEIEQLKMSLRKKEAEWLDLKRKKNTR